MNFQICSIDPSEKGTIYDFTRKWFFVTEPICSSWTNLPSRNEVSYTRALDQRLSIKAMDDEENLAAICINGDDNKLMENSPEQLPDNLQKLYDFFDMVESESKVESNLLSVMVVSVALSYRRQGLCTKLLNKCLSIASENGFRGAKILCTSKHSASAAASAGWECVFIKPYSDYTDPLGHPIYSPPMPHTHVSVYQKLV